MNQYAAKQTWTPMQEKFVELVGSGVAPTEAARQAGSERPGPTACDWMDMPHIRSAIFKKLRMLANTKVEWRELIEEAKKVLHLAMRMGDIKEATAAAGKCLDVATKIGEETLASKASREDACISLQELAEASLGKPASVSVVVVPLPSGDKETEH